MSGHIAIGARGTYGEHGAVEVDALPVKGKELADVRCRPPPELGFIAQPHPQPEPHVRHAEHLQKAGLQARDVRAIEGRGVSRSTINPTAVFRYPGLTFAMHFIAVRRTWVWRRIFFVCRPECHQMRHWRRSMPKFTRATFMPKFELRTSRTSLPDRHSAIPGLNPRHNCSNMGKKMTVWRRGVWICDWYARLCPPRPPDRARGRNTPGRVARGAWAFVGARGALTAPDRLSARIRCGNYAGVPFGAAV